MSIQLLQQQALFRDFVNLNSVHGLTCDGRDSLYLPLVALQEYWNLPKLRDVLGWASITSRADAIHYSYLMVFSTLFFISDRVRSLDCLNSLISRKNNDSSLPWKGMPLGLAHTPEGPQVFDAFAKEQPRFCPVLLGPGPFSGIHWNTVLERDAIFPITSAGPPRSQRESSTQTMEVHQRAYSHLPAEQKEQAPKHVFFKTYRTEDHAEYESECNVYAALSSQSEHITRCLGTFCWSSGNNENSSTIVLEFAEKGSLLDMYGAHEPPSTSEGIIAIWETMHGLAKGLEVLHMHADLHVVHQDVKPSNLLLFRHPKNDDRSAFTLKITDFGSSHPSRDTKATKTYSPPELLLNHGIRYSVSYDYDIWSMGCVFMETAVWVVYGERGRQKFEELRKRETGSLPQHDHLGTRYCFHDGKGRLQCLQQVADAIYRDVAGRDNITAKVVDMVLHGLLVEEGERLSAKNVYHKLSKITHDAKAQQKGLESPHHAEHRASLGSTYSKPVGQRTSFPGELDSVQRFSTPPQTSRPELPELDTQQLHPAVSEGEPNSPPINHPESPQIDSAAQEKEQPAASRDREGPYPHVSVAELETWRRRKKKGHRYNLPGRDQVIRDLPERDFMLLIDNGTSMQKHCAEVLRMVEGLAYLIKEIDPNGSQIMCTSDLKDMQTFKDARTATAFVSRKFARGAGNPCKMEIALSPFLDHVHSELQSAGQTRVWRRRRQGKPITVLIFTDGIWDSDDSDDIDDCRGVDGAIEACIKTMRDAGWPRTRIALQFLQFGSDEKGGKRLQFLDDELKKKHENFDIVDTKPTTAGIWDILVASVWSRNDG